jgi:hypothetical protein
MSGHIYVAQLECHPVPTGLEGHILSRLMDRSVAVPGSFAVQDCQCTGTGVNIQVASPQPLAAHWFVSLVEQILSEFGSSLVSGFISQVIRNSAGAAAGALAGGIGGAKLGSKSGPAGALLGFLTGVILLGAVGHALDGTHLVPAAGFTRDHAGALQWTTW